MYTFKCCTHLNMNTAFKCVQHILGNLQLLQTVAELHDDAHYYFTRSFNPLMGEVKLPICVRRDANLHPEPPGSDIKLASSL